MSEPRRGAIAYCSQGHLGIITDSKPRPVIYGDGEHGMAWHGVHIGKKFLGQLWSSRYPRVVGHVDDLVEFSPDRARALKQQVEGLKAQLFECDQEVQRLEEA